MLEHGGEVTGIIPEFLTKRERPRRLAQELIVTRDMHERKRTMFERADAFVALPGGIGTLEELVEQMTWAQLGRHKKPILIANINGYWDPLLALVDHMRAVKFVPPALQRRFSGRRARRGNPADAARGGAQGRRSGEGDGGPGGAAVTHSVTACVEFEPRADWAASRAIPPPQNVTASMRLPSGSRMKAA